MTPHSLIDNVHRRLIDDLRDTLRPGARVSVAAASFSIYAFEALQRELSEVTELRFIFTSPTFNKERADKQLREFYIPKLHRERSLYGSDFELRLRGSGLEQRAVARECAEWIRRKARFKTNVTQRDIPGFLHVAGAADGPLVYQPIRELTSAELGCEPGSSVFQFINRQTSPTSDAYLAMFDQLWQDDHAYEDVTATVVENIENLYRENAPEFIYFTTLYHIFREFLSDLSEDVLPNEATGFRDSAVWRKLYHFQRDAALGIIQKLEQYNGCILADSVGLGKTFTALAVIKYYETRNKSVLVLCPKKLQANWTTYKGNYRNNPLVQDRLRYDVLFHTDLSRDGGTSNGIDLALLNWGNYDLIVIDESHNFRNGGKLSDGEDDAPQRENRYQRLMNRVLRDGVRTKVLMLSATPVNNRFADLRNQLQLACEGDQELWAGKLPINRPIEDVFRAAQTEYNRWARLAAPAERTAARLLQMLPFDFFTVLDAVTIARSRRHIERYYDTADIGRFPTRLPPLSRRAPLTDLPASVSYRLIAARLEHDLTLAVYAPSAYILPSRRDRYDIDRDGRGHHLGMAGREKGIKRLMATNLLKRLESSVHSFRLTLGRIQRQIDDTLAAIADFETTRADRTLTLRPLEGIDYGDEAESDLIVGGRRTQVALADMDCLSWRADLECDRALVADLLAQFAPITPQHDSKLRMLLDDVRHKMAHPINGDNRKVIVFTAFSDTAEYLYRELAPMLRAEGVHTGLVTGDAVASTVRGLRADFNQVLTLFAPVAKEADKLLPGRTDEIDLLIATDCISEGQNLQDCDYLINYDIHWNPVRIIQRFGRVDRIGSRNAEIQLVNYWPDIELDDYLQLKGRVEARMAGVDIAAGGQGNVLLADDEQTDLDYRRAQLRRLQDEVVDLEEMDTGISIMDLGLNDFRMDLLAYAKQHPDLEHTPLGLHAVVPATEGTPPGVVFILKNRNNAVNIDRRNRLHPFYMVYVAQDGTVVADHLEPKRVLDLMRHLCRGRSEPLADLCRRFNAETRDGRHMGTYSRLLGQAIASVVSVRAQSDVAAFLGGDPTALGGAELRGLDDFDLICFLVIK